MGDRVTYVGLDIHKEGIVVAVAEGGIRGRSGNMAGSPTRRRHRIALQKPRLRSGPAVRLGVTPRVPAKHRRAAGPPTSATTAATR
jgi:hypothetical protein